jgi:hypothetical protein
MLASIIFTAVVVAVMVWCGRLTAQYAAARGRSTRAWFVWGTVLFPLFPIQWLVLALLPKK